MKTQERIIAEVKRLRAECEKLDIKITAALTTEFCVLL